MNENAGRGDVVQIDCEILRWSKAAIQIQKGDHVCWIPKSLLIEQVELEIALSLLDMSAGKCMQILIPEWLAVKEGLV